jgi:hypothetical protein
VFLYKNNNILIKGYFMSTKYSNSFLIQNESFKSSLFNNIYSEFEMNVVIEGAPKQVLEAMLKNGYASTQSEAIRLALFWFGQSRLNQDELAAQKMDKIYADIKSGKIKTLPLKQMARKYPEFKELI